jgi:hypothetical protein
MNQTPTGWLLLVHQLPAKPAYLRVKTWRRLQTLGAVALKGSVYVLPATEQTLEDMAWLAKEIRADGGEAVLCEARLAEGLSEAQARELFTAPRAADYGMLAEEARAFDKALPQDALTHWDGAEELKAQLARLRKRLAQIAAIDFFAAEGREAVEAALARLDARLAPPDAPASAQPDLPGLHNLTWVTRAGVKVDRIACAWLIRRFIDPEARFKFVAPKGYVPAPGELRFDMYEAEFTHEGDRCSFEVLLDRIGSEDAALRAIGEIVHDIDLKDAKFGRDEVAGVAHLLDGLAGPGRSDAERIERGTVLLDSLYDYFRGERRG